MKLTLSDAGTSRSISPAVAAPVNAALKYAKANEVEELVLCFEDPANPNHELISMQIHQRGHDDARTPLDWASLLGHVDVITELIKRGVDVNAVNEKGSPYGICLNMQINIVCTSFGLYKHRTVC